MHHIATHLLIACAEKCAAMIIANHATCCFSQQNTSIYNSDHGILLYISSALMFHVYYRNMEKAEFNLCALNNLACNPSATVLTSSTSKQSTYAYELHMYKL